MRVKALFDSVAKNELAAKKRQADAIHEADIKGVLEYYNKKSARFYEKCKQQHDEIDRLYEK